MYIEKYKLNFNNIVYNHITKQKDEVLDILLPYDDANNRYTVCKNIFNLTISNNFIPKLIIRSLNDSVKITCNQTFKLVPKSQLSIEFSSDDNGGTWLVNLLKYGKILDNKQKGHKIVPFNSISDDLKSNNILYKNKKQLADSNNINYDNIINEAINKNNVNLSPKKDDTIQMMIGNILVIVPTI